MGRRVGVIGGGVAGLSAAFAAVEAGTQVTLFERTQLYGGRVVGGEDFDTGRHLITTAYRDFLWLTEKLGSTGQLQLRPQAYGAQLGRRQLWWRMGSLPGPALQMLFSGFLPLPQRFSSLWKLAAALADAPVEPTDIELAGPGESAPLMESERSVADLISQWPAEFVTRFADPVCRGMMNGSPEQLSAGPLLAALLRSMRDRKRLAGWVRGNWGALITEPAPSVLSDAGVQTVMGADVQRVSRKGDGWQIEWTGGSAEFDAVVVALPPESLNLLSGVEEAKPLLEMAGTTHGNTIITVRAAVSGVDALPGPLAETDGDRPIWFAEPRDGFVNREGATPGQFEGPTHDVLVERVISGRPNDPRPSASVEREDFRRLFREIFGRELEAEHGEIEVRYTISATPTLAPDAHRPTLRITDSLLYAGDWAATRLPATLESACRAGRLSGRLAAGETV